MHLALLRAKAFMCLDARAHYNCSSDISPCSPLYGSAACSLLFWQLKQQSDNIQKPNLLSSDESLSPRLESKMFIQGDP